jgi:hypothetical protein
MPFNRYLLRNGRASDKLRRAEPLGEFLHRSAIAGYEEESSEKGSHAGARGRRCERSART